MDNNHFSQNQINRLLHSDLDKIIEDQEAASQILEAVREAVILDQSIKSRLDVLERAKQDRLSRIKDTIDVEEQQARTSKRILDKPLIDLTQSQKVSPDLIDFTKPWSRAPSVIAPSASAPSVETMRVLNPSIQFTEPQNASVSSEIDTGYYGSNEGERILRNGLGYPASITDLPKLIKKYPEIRDTLAMIEGYDGIPQSFNRTDTRQEFLKHLGIGYDSNDSRFAKEFNKIKSELNLPRTNDLGLSEHKNKRCEILQLRELVHNPSKRNDWLSLYLNRNQLLKTGGGRIKHSSKKSKMIRGGSIFVNNKNQLRKKEQELVGEIHAGNDNPELLNDLEDIRNALRN
jgi:hypothetical protein